jgi:hypothetical protein
MMQLLIYSTPPIVIREPVLQDVGTLNAGINGETPNMTIVIENGRGGLTSLFTRPPLRARAVLSDDAETLFQGTVQAVSIASQITIDIEG